MAGQGTQDGKKSTEIISAAVFRLEVIGMEPINFAELVGISSEVENAEYMAAGSTGAVFSRHFGRTKPPTITLKRGLDLNGELWLWHQKVRNLMYDAYKDAALKLYGPGDDLNGAARVTYMMSNAWPSKVEVSGVKAGATDIVYQTVTLMCDDLFDANAKI
ncbi:phage tail protein [Actinoplanes sp. NPDC051346]|uniref:phage tail protein n=1 Tax=Actinoplanes sp. NPDC051346 TaxID=3155048 RepID=UPI00342F6ADF